MKYWPLSVIAQSPLMLGAYVDEINRFYKTLPSQGAYYACIDVARHTQPVDAPNMSIVGSIGAPDRRVYVNYPDSAEWLKLERATVMEDNGYMFILVDALH